MVLVSQAMRPLTLCRYKTGRCMNPRVVKPNGAPLLLCEYHRCQQNRTKKRSDMKYRQHRAAKRQLARAGVGCDSIDRSTLSPTDQTIRAALSPSEKRHVKRRKTTEPLPPVDTAVLNARTPTSAASAPLAVTCSSTRVKIEFCNAFFATDTSGAEPMASGSPTTAADFESAASPWPSLWADVLLPAESSPPPQSALELPAPAAWEPEELALLEYFILS